MNNKEFIPYELALELKQLGFDEPCFGYYDGWYETKRLIISPDTSINELNGDIDAPTYSQAFRLFRENYNLHGWCFTYGEGQYDYVIYSNGKLKDTNRGYFNTYEEAELACLRKLIEIIKEKLK